MTQWSLSVWHLTEITSGGPSASWPTPLQFGNDFSPLLCIKEVSSSPHSIPALHPQYLVGRSKSTRRQNLLNGIFLWLADLWLDIMAACWTTHSHTLVLAAGSAQLLGQQGDGTQRNLGRAMWGKDSPSQTFCFKTDIYKMSILHIYSKDGDIHMYIYKCYTYIYLQCSICFLEAFKYKIRQCTRNSPLNFKYYR